ISGDVDVSYFGKAVVRLLDPGAQRGAPGAVIRLQVRSLNAAAGHPPVFTADGLPGGLSISASGLIAGTISGSATGAHRVTVTALPPAGATVSVTFMWPVPKPVSQSSTQP